MAGETRSSFTIWNEEGEGVPASYHGTIEAASFDQAVDLLAQRPGPFRANYNAESRTWCGQKLVTK